MKDSNCIGIRVYYGATAINSKGRQDLRLILVGVEKKVMTFLCVRAPGLKHRLWAVAEKVGLSMANVHLLVMVTAAIAKFAGRILLNLIPHDF